MFTICQKFLPHCHPQYPHQLSYPCLLEKPGHTSLSKDGLWAEPMGPVTRGLWLSGASRLLETRHCKCTLDIDRWRALDCVPVSPQCEISEEIRNYISSQLWCCTLFTVHCCHFCMQRITHKTDLKCNCATKTLYFTHFWCSFDIVIASEQYIS